MLFPHSLAVLFQRVSPIAVPLFQRKGAKILFGEYSDIKMAYGLPRSLRMIFSKNTIKDAPRLSMAKWYSKVDNSYNNRASNTAAESFNAKIKLFRANLHGVVDKKFFLFRIVVLYGFLAKFRMTR